MTINSLDELFEGRETVPPYPQDFKIPEYIRKQWNYINIGIVGGQKIVPVLKMKEQIFLPEIGDMFNVIVMPRKIRKGKRTRHRIFQFRGLRQVLMGYIIEGASQYDYQTVEKGQDLRKDIVVRVEVIDVRPPEFYCVALAHTFNRSNIEYNLVHCNYERAR